MRFLVCPVLLVVSCSPGGPCSPATCTGCCDAMDRCVEGTQDGACGNDGTRCADCRPAGTCQASACAPRCTAASCGGCCDSEGTCQRGDAVTACGLGGATCADCFAAGRRCDIGACLSMGSGGGSGVGGGAGGGSETGGGGGFAGGGGTGGAGGTGGTGGAAGSGGSGGGSTLGAAMLRVFTTSINVLPSFGGLAGGDAVCANLATDAGLPGTFAAWLSTPDAGAVVRFSSLDAHWVMPGSPTVFNNAAQLRQTPNVPLTRDERGALISAGSAWTGTLTGGQPSGFACLNWTNAMTATGTFGTVITTTNWTTNGIPALCSTARRLYCFQTQ